MITHKLFDELLEDKVGDGEDVGEVSGQLLTATLELEAYQMRLGSRVSSAPRPNRAQL
jgi:hypothetical protein